MQLEILPKQREFLQSDSPVICYRGAIRAGKTFVGAIKTAIHCQAGEHILAVAPTFTMLRDNVAATVQEICTMMHIPCKVNMSNKEILIGAGKIILRSAENPDSIRGFAADRMWIDEASFIKDNKAYLRGFGRLSRNPNRQVYITSSPSGKDWVYKLMQTTPKSHLIVQALYDNYFLDEAFFETLLAEYGGLDSPFAKQELFGEIVNFNSEFFPTDKIRYANDIQIKTLCQAIDLGFGTNKTSDYSAYALCGIDYDDNFVVIHVDRWRQEAPRTKAIIKECISAVDCTIPCLIESNGAQKVIYQDLVIDSELSDYTLIPVRNSISKAARALGMANSMNSGRVIFNESNESNEIVVDELAGFTVDGEGAEHDDMMDAIVMCYNHLKYGDATMSKVRI